MPDTPLTTLLTASIAHERKRAMNQQQNEQNSYTCAECGGEAIIGHGNEPERVCSRCFRMRQPKPQFFSQTDKLAWVIRLKALAIELFEAVEACPHAGGKHLTCDRCWLLNRTWAMLEEFAERERERINSEYQVRPMESEEDR